MAIPLLWIAAAPQARRGRGGLAAALLTLSAGLELWGILGLPVLLLLPRVRSAALWALAAGAALCALLLPFAAFGRFNMLAYHWEVADGTLLHLFVAAHTPFTWPLRALQGGAAIAAGALAARRLRHSSQAVWVVPLAVVATRIVLDPIYNPWYWLAPQTLGVLGAAAFLAGGGADELRSRMRTRVGHITPSRG